MEDHVDHGQRRVAASVEHLVVQARCLLDLLQLILDNLLFVIGQNVATGVGYC